MGGERIEPKAEAESTGARLPLPSLVFHSGAPSRQPGQFRGAAPSLRRGGGGRGLSAGIWKWAEGEPQEPAGAQPGPGWKKWDGESPGCGLSREARPGHLQGERGRSETRLSMH